MPLLSHDTAIGGLYQSIRRTTRHIRDAVALHRAARRRRHQLHDAAWHERHFMLHHAPAPNRLADEAPSPRRSSNP